MKMSFRFCLVAALLFACAALCWAASKPPRYVFTDLGDAPGVTSSHAVAINNLGQVAIGTSTKHGPRSSVWLPHKPNGPTGKFQDLGIIPYEESAQNEDAPETRVCDINDNGIMVGISGSGDSYKMADYSDGFRMRVGDRLSRAHILGPEKLAVPDAINNRGVIVGVFQDATTSHAMIWPVKGKARSLGKLHNGDQLCGANDVNERGVIVGYSDEHAWLLTGKRMRDLGRGCANAINNHDVIVGRSEDRACMWINGNRRTLDQRKYPPGVSAYDGPGSGAVAINDSGAVVGYVPVSVPAETGGKARREFRAAMWVDSRMTLLTDAAGVPSGWTLTSADAINNKGQIVGTGRIDGNDENTRAFLLTPVR